MCTLWSQNATFERFKIAHYNVPLPPAQIVFCFTMGRCWSFAVVAAFWSEVLLAALNHHFLPAKLHQADRDVSLSVYPKMFHNLVIRNNLHSKRKRDRRITFRSGGRRTSSTLTIDSVETTASGNLYHTSFLSESFGENLNFEYIESDQESGVSYV